MSLYNNNWDVELKTPAKWLQPGVGGKSKGKRVTWPFNLNRVVSMWADMKTVTEIWRRDTYECFQQWHACLHAYQLAAGDTMLPVTEPISTARLVGGLL